MKNTTQRRTLSVEESTLRALNWHPIEEALAVFAVTDVGRERCLGRNFVVDPDWLSEQLQTVAEFQKLLGQGHGPNLLPCADLGHQLRRVAEGRMLLGEEFVAIGNGLRATAHVRANLEALDETTFSGISALGVRLPDTMPTARWIFSSFEPNGKLRDDATPHLSDLRRRHVRLLQSTKRKMEDFIHSFELQPYLQDSYYTVRDERFVLPVKAQNRPSVEGIIHGSSATGATVYIEPQEMVGANNELLLLHEEMEREVQKILLERTERLLGELDDLTQVLDVITECDTYLAKAHFANAYDCSVPKLSIQGETKLINARNPALLVKGNDVVPNTLHLGEEHQFLVITGPNTGGKTVTLMTFGLLALMAEMGIPVPVDAGSSIALFPRLFTLFGDPQDLYSDQSTFSGQLVRVNAVLDQAGPGAFVLMDEPIVGTEPAGGAALAIALLEYMADRGVRGAVTTHYDRLKTLSLNDERFQNASVGLDPTTLKPNFHLTQGVAGSSSPIAIAEQLGMRPAVIQRARKLSGESPESLQSAIGKLDEQRASLAQAEADLRDEKKRLETVKENLITRGAEEARRTQEEVLSSLAEAQNLAKAAIRSFQDGADARQIQRYQKRLKEAEVKVEKSTPKAPSPAPKKKDSIRTPDLKSFEFFELKKGTRVYLVAHGKEAVVSETPDSPSRIPVSIGALRLRVTLADLAHPPVRAMDAEVAASKRRASAKSEPANRSLPPKVAEYQVDLRGARVDDALDTLAQRLDRAMLENRHALYIIHGHGSGALKKALRTHLARSRYVNEWVPAHPEDGGDGATVVFLED